MSISDCHLAADVTQLVDSIVIKIVGLYICIYTCRLIGIGTTLNTL